MNNGFSIKAYQSAYRQQILDVWERSVIATHHFLKPADFEDIRTLLYSMNFSDLAIYCLVNPTMLAGFIGVADKRIEMLFIDPLYFGKGFGKTLVNFAITALDAHALDVNEQNEGALQFYQHLGFEIAGRKAKDDQGRDYPLLTMQLKASLYESI